MTARRVVDIDFRKWDGSAHYRFAADRLGADAAGTWLGVRAGTPFTGPRPGNYQRSFLMLIPTDQWWVATWGFSEELELYVDVATPAVWAADDHMTTIDLDLDVIRYRDGRVVLDDEEEFEKHRVLYSYPDDLVQTATSTARRLLDAVAQRREPFGSAADEWEELAAAR